MSYSLKIACLVVTRRWPSYKDPAKTKNAPLFYSRFFLLSYELHARGIYAICKMHDVNQLRKKHLQDIIRILVLPKFEILNFMTLLRSNLDWIELD